MLRRVAIAAMYVLFAIRNHTIILPFQRMVSYRNGDSRNGRTAVAGGALLISIRAAPDLQIGQRIEPAFDKFEYRHSAFVAWVSVRRTAEKPLFEHAPIFDGLRAGLATKDSFQGQEKWVVHSRFLLFAFSPGVRFPCGAVIC